MSASAEARLHTLRIRECVLAILRDSWPMPWPTPYLQDAFAPRDFPRVSAQLTRLADAGEVLKAHTPRWNWWVAIGDPLGVPACRCGRPGTAIVWWYSHGGWWCGDRQHYAEVVTQDWPWPQYDELVETLVVVR